MKAAVVALLKVAGLFDQEERWAVDFGVTVFQENVSRKTQHRLLLHQRYIRTSYRYEIGQFDGNVDWRYRRVLVEEVLRFLALTSFPSCQNELLLYLKTGDV